MSYTKIKPLKDRVYLHKSLKECLKIFNIKSRETVEVPCPFCLSEEKKFFFKIDDLSYFHCKKCRSIYNSPRLNHNDLKKYYSVIYQSLELQQIQRETYDQRMEIIMRPRWRAIKENLMNLGLKLPVSSILEVGPGVGYFTAVLQMDNIASRYVLVEPEKDCVKKLKELPNSLIYNGNIEDCDDPRYNNNDLIFINSVIEHPFSLTPFFNSANRLLKSGGRICLVDMNAAGLDIEILRGEADNVNPHQILQIGTVEGIHLIAKRSGFSVEKVFPMGTMDAEILYEYAQSLSENNSLHSFTRLLKKKEVREDLQNLLRKHLITGYLGYILKKN